MPQKIKLHGTYDQKIADEKKNHRINTVRQGWGKGMVEKPTLTMRMLHPYFWKDWAAMFAYKLLCTCLPYGIQMALGAGLGKIVKKYLKSRTYVLRRNLELAFPKLSETERERLSDEILTNAGKAVFETGIAWFWSDKRLLKHACIAPEDLQIAREAAQSGRPIIVLTCHMFTLEIMARLFALLIKPGVGVYRPSDHPVWEYTQVKGRLRTNLALVNHKDPKSIIRTLMQGHTIWYAPDQDYGERAAVFVPFFGVSQAATITGTHDLARIKDAIVLPSFTYRKGSQYVLRCLKPLENFPTKDATADTIVCNQVLEQMIGEAKEQYLWLHRRFKTTPPGVDPKERYPEIES
ncbi:MAG: LpxL/LpxP family Kdo(2)-lipid IV(A) lauroyl/palmitoleoyl acyltransferase [Succinivibrio sp.]|nr:LpxL/LpxP family Kdo(2)-lipid IV(A) lauroyl/palmitoleoyl acyltransferase [Succinivibrio sp.]